MKKGWSQATGCGHCFVFPSVLWHWWLGDRKDIEDPAHRKPCSTNSQRFASETDGAREQDRDQLTWTTWKNGHWLEVLLLLLLAEIVYAVELLAELCGVHDRKSMTQTVRFTQHLVVLGQFSCTTVHHTPLQPFYGPFSGTTQVSRCQKRTSGLYGARED